MVLENSLFSFSNSQYPLTPSANSSLFDVDKPLYYLLNFNAGMLNIYANAYFLTQIALAGLPNLTQIVQDTRPYNPVPYLTDTNLGFPLLAMWRGEGHMEKMESISYFRIVSDIHLLYLLPPLTATQREYLQPMLTGALAILKDRNESGWDPNYESGAKIGQLAGYEALNCKHYEMTEFPGVKSELPFVCLYMTFEIWEIPTANINVSQQYVTSTGMDGYINLSDGYQPPIDDFVEINSNYQPTNPEDV